jgi:hypothetical protein
MQLEARAVKVLIKALVKRTETGAIVKLVRRVIEGLPTPLAGEHACDGELVEELTVKGTTTFGPAHHIELSFGERCSPLSVGAV